MRLYETDCQKLCYTKKRQAAVKLLKISKERKLWAETNGGHDRHVLPLSIDNYKWKTKNVIYSL